WVGTLFAQDQPRALGPGGQVHVLGGFGDPGTLAHVVVLDRWIPGRGRDRIDDVLDPEVDREPEGEPHPLLPAGSSAGVGGPGRGRTRQLPRGLSITRPGTSLGR